MTFLEACYLVIEAAKDPLLKPTRVVFGCVLLRPQRHLVSDIEMAITTAVSAADQAMAPIIETSPTEEIGDSLSQILENAARQLGDLIVASRVPIGEVLFDP